MPTYRNGIDHRCPRCQCPIRATAAPGAEKPGLLDLLDQIKREKRDPPTDPATAAQELRRRALERIATRVKMLTWDEAVSGHAVVGPFSWKRLMAARDTLARIDAAIEAGKAPKEDPMDQP
jgi:hypothetical protein